MSSRQFSMSLGARAALAAFHLKVAETESNAMNLKIVI